MRSRAIVRQQQICRIVAVGIPVSSSPLMREIDSMLSDYGLSQSGQGSESGLGRGQRSSATDIRRGVEVEMATHDDGASCLPRS